MSIEIEPLELNFRRPFTIEVAQTLTIKNPTSSPLAFKVKTTAPKHYCVRPNAGRIEPGQDFDVTVLLQALKSDPPLDTKCRDKFLVQSAPITPEKEFASVASVLESTDKSSVQERKIRVNWLAADDSLRRNDGPVQAGAVTPSKHSTNDLSHDTPEAQRVFSSPRATVDHTHLSNIHTDVVVKEDHQENSNIPPSTMSQAANAISETAQATYEELKAKLVQAEAHIAKLKDSGLRQRNLKTSPAEDVRQPASVAQPIRQPEGVPVPMVAILCLLSFLLAYLFF